MPAGADKRFFKVLLAHAQGGHAPGQRIFLLRIHSFFGGVFTSMCRSRSWRAVTGAGASVIKSAPLAVFGKAITSRMLGVLQRMALSRSNPSAMPPCGGAP